MVPNIRNIRFLVLIVFILLWTSGCIREDNSDCPRGLYVYFTPENPKHDLSELFRRADLYFFNAAGDLAFRRNYGSDALREDGQSIFAGKIPQGNYLMVAIINDVDHYRTIGEQGFGTLQTSLEKEVSREHLVDFFSGKCEVLITQGNSPTEIWVDIFKHNNDIRLEVLFQDYELPGNSSLISHIEGNNGSYEYKNASCPEDSYRQYLPYSISGQQDMKTFDFSVMRLWRDSDLTLWVKELNDYQQETGSVSVKITDKLAEVVDKNGEFLFNTDKKLSFHDEFKITIKLRADLTILELTINDWYVTGGEIDV